MGIPAKHFKHLASRSRKPKRQPKPLTPEQHAAVIRWGIHMQLFTRTQGGYFSATRLKVHDNMREHKFAKMHRVQKERMVGAEIARQIKPVLPCIITFTRYSSRLVDDDGLKPIWKAHRDSIAKALGTHDGASAPIKWDYKQAPAPRHCYGFSCSWAPMKTFENFNEAAAAILIAPPVPEGDGGRG